ncbi:MAG: PQQ-like beta-propeller repeat protein [Bdellovibrionales bacterium]|nr:PQQ-like beta-propeller repeat protein [Bdellovibrionales bacterium]
MAMLTNGTFHYCWVAQKCETIKPLIVPSSEFMAWVEKVITVEPWNLEILFRESLDVNWLKSTSQLLGGGIVLCILVSCQLADNQINGAIKNQAVSAQISFVGSFSDKTYSSTIEVRVEFSGPVSGLSETHFDVQNASITQVLGSGSEYTLVLTPLSYGSVTISYVGGANISVNGLPDPITVEYTRYPYPIRFLSLGSSSGLFRIIPVPGTGDQIYVGYYIDGGNRVYVRRETNAGELVWERALKMHFFDNGAVMGSTVYVAGKKNSFYGMALALDLDTGEPLWARDFVNSTFGSRVYVYDSVGMGDGGLTLVGESVNVMSGSDGGMIINTNAAGIIEWQKRFDGDSTKDSALYKVAQSGSSDDILGVGSMETGGGDRYLWFLKLTNAGVPLVNKVFDVGPGTLGSFLDISSTIDGHFVLLGEISGQPVIVKVDGSGNIIWVWRPVETSVGLNRVRQLSNGQYFAVGFNSSNQPVVISVSDTGSFLWGKSLSRDSFFYDLAEAEDQSIKLAGYSVTLGALITKINFDGSVAQYDCAEWWDFTLTDSTLTLNESAGPVETTSNVDINTLIDQATLQSATYAATPSASEVLYCEP